MTIATNTLFRDGMPPAPPNHAAESKRLTELGQRAEECLIRALAESALNDAVRKEVGRQWGEYKEAVQRALHNMVEAAVDEMLTTKESFGKLREAIAREVKERFEIDVDEHVEQRIRASENRLIIRQEDVHKSVVEDTTVKLNSMYNQIEEKLSRTIERVERRKKGK